MNTSVKLTQIIKEFDLEIEYAPDNYRELCIIQEGVNRPALQLAGFFDAFDSDRVQVIGKVEFSYLSGLTSEERRKSFDELFAHNIPILIYAYSLPVFEECIEMAKKYGIVIAKTSEMPTNLIDAMSASLKVHLGPVTQMHGVFVEVYGEGVLLLGESGVGKSETAVELIKRGHRLIADDAVEIKRVSSKTLVGTSPELIRYFIELRGIGIVDVRRLFGMGAVKPTEKVELVVYLEKWIEGKKYERLGMDENYTEILDIKVPSLTVPVQPGRNLAIVIEVAAMNLRHKKMGYNAARELDKRMREMAEREMGGLS